MDFGLVLIKAEVCQCKLLQTFHTRTPTTAWSWSLPERVSDFEVTMILVNRDFLDFLQQHCAVPYAFCCTFHSRTSRSSWYGFSGDLNPATSLDILDLVGSIRFSALSFIFVVLALLALGIEACQHPSCVSTYDLIPTCCLLDLNWLESWHLRTRTRLLPGGSHQKPADHRPIQQKQITNARADE